MKKLVVFLALFLSSCSPYSGWDCVHSLKVKVHVGEKIKTFFCAEPVFGGYFQCRETNEDGDNLGTRTFVSPGNNLYTVDKKQCGPPETIIESKPKESI